jgi:RNA polymerase sigma-70 factor (sigma-E family)
VGGEPLRATVASQAVEALLGGSDTAALPAVAAGFLSAPVDDAIGEQDADSGETAVSSETAGGDGAGVGDTAVPAGSAVINGAAASADFVTVNGATIINGATVANGSTIANGAVVLSDATVLSDAVDAFAVADPDAEAEVSATVSAPAELAASAPDGAAGDPVVPATEIDGGNLGSAGEPLDTGARRTDVTETLAASALMPEVVLAPEAFTSSQARTASAAWDASELVTEIYTGHYNQLVRLAVLLVHDVQTAEEVVQDAFEAMHLAWRRLRDSEKALSYLRQTVVNRSRSVLRHRKVVDMHAPKPAPDEPSAEHAALTLLERSAVAEALRSLPLRQREAIVLRYYADFSEADIAAAMGISRGAVKSHTARAMAALKSSLAEETS